MTEKRAKKTGRKVADPVGARAKRKASRGPRTLDYMKPKRFKNYLTLTELALFIPADPSWIRRLEKEGRIPEAQRVPMGALMIRLWSPAQARETQSIIEGHRLGRPKNS